MDCYKPYQPYGDGLLQATAINGYKHTHNSLACMVCTMRQAQSHTHTTMRSLHKAKRAHRGREFEKKVLSLTT